MGKKKNISKWFSDVLIFESSYKPEVSCLFSWFCLNIPWAYKNKKAEIVLKTCTNIYNKPAQGHSNKLLSKSLHIFWSSGNILPYLLFYME